MNLLLLVSIALMGYVCAAVVAVAVRRSWQVADRERCQQIERLEAELRLTRRDQ